MKMTLSSPNSSNERPILNSDNKSLSPSSSPRSSPRPSPRPQTKRDHTKSDTHLTVNYNKEQQQSSFKHDGSPSSQEGSISSRLSSSDLNAGIPDLKLETCNSSTKERKEGRSKKKSWLNSFYPTYKSKCDDFKRIFKDVPVDERLVIDYSCALQKEILVQGRLYVTQNYLCFYANIFGWETNVTLKWKEVAAITKEKTALVIPNAVLICTRSEKYFFTSFVTRDKTYLMLFRVWQNALMDQPMTPQELWQGVHQSYGNELGLTSDDEDYVAPYTEDDKFSARLSVESFSEQESASVIFETMDQVLDNRHDDSAKLPNSMEPRGSGYDSHIPTDVSDNSESDIEKPLKIKLLPPSIVQENFPNSFNLPPPTPDSDDNSAVLENFKSDMAYKCTSAHEGRQLLNEILPIHLDQLFTLLFTSSKFYLDFHAARKTTDLTQTPWTHNPLDNSKSRIVNLTIALSQAMGPKTAQVTETQVMLPCSKAGYLYAIDVESINGGIPYADSFIVVVHYCLQKISETQSSMSVYAQVKYRKSVWGLVKGMIERNCWSGLEEFFATLLKALHVEGEENIPDIKRKSRKKRRIHSMPRPGIETPRISDADRQGSQFTGTFSPDVTTLIVFAVLMVLLVLNVMLYHKLWSLEETHPYSLLDLHSLKNPPKSHEEWVRLLQQQETLHAIELQKWQKILKASIQILKQAEDSLKELRSSIHPTYTNKIMSLLKDSKDALTDKEEL